jgi:hypothetical protein
MLMKIQTKRPVLNHDTQHVLTWSFGQFKNTFPTPVSGLPELLFNKGFCAYKLSCLQIHSFYATNMVTNSMTEPTSNSSHVIPFESQELLDDFFNDSDDDAINILFMINENVILKDDKGITGEVTYLGPQFSDEILQHKVCNKNGHEFLVDGTLVSSINAPNISTIPVSVEQYGNELHKFTREQLQQISHPQVLDDDQQELMKQHYRMNHLPFPAMITLVEKGKLNRKFAKLRHKLPVCMSCMFGTVHCKPWRLKGEKGSIRKPSDNAPGKCVSIDQMISTQPGLIPQMAGFLTISESGVQLFSLITSQTTFLLHSCMTSLWMKHCWLRLLSNGMLTKVVLILNLIVQTTDVLLTLDFNKL